MELKQGLTQEQRKALLKQVRDLTNHGRHLEAEQVYRLLFA